MSPKASPARVLVLHKTIDPLDALREAADGLSLTGLSALTAMPKPTVYRMLATLESHGYLERTSKSDYRISRKLFEAPRDTTVCHETLNLGVLDGGEVLVVETVESQQAVRMSSKIGHRRYPHSTALGKALIADLPQRDVLRLARGQGLPDSQRFKYLVGLGLLLGENRIIAVTRSYEYLRPTISF